MKWQYRLAQGNALWSMRLGGVRPVRAAPNMVALIGAYTGFYNSKQEDICIESNINAHLTIKNMGKNC